MEMFFRRVRQKISSQVGGWLEHFAPSDPMLALPAPVVDSRELVFLTVRSGLELPEEWELADGGAAPGARRLRGCVRLEERFVHGGSSRTIPRVALFEWGEAHAYRVRMWLACF